MGLLDAPGLSKQTADARYAPFWGAKVAFIGNSIGNGARAIASDVYAHGPNVYSANIVHGGSPATYAMLASDGRWELVTNAGVAGDTTTLMLARLQTDVISTGATVCVLGEAFRNDPVQVIPFATTQANVASMVTQLKAAGIRPVICTPTPDDPTSPGAPFKLYNAKLSRWLYGYCLANGIPLVDWYSPLVDPTTGNLAAAYRAATPDVHPNDAGNNLLGQAVDAVLRQVIPPRPAVLAANAGDTTDLFLSAGMFLGAPTSGVAGSWSGSLQSGCVATITTDPAVKGNMQRLTCTSTTGDSFVFGNFINTGYSIGDTVEVSGIVNVGGGVLGRVQLTAGGGTPYSNVKTVMVNNAVSHGRFRHRFVVPSGTTSLNLGLYAGAGTGYVEYGQISVRNLTALGLS